jgi:hypothetical protein
MKLLIKWYDDKLIISEILDVTYLMKKIHKCDYLFTKLRALEYSYQVFIKLSPL